MYDTGYQLESLKSVMKLLVCLINASFHVHHHPCVSLEVSFLYICYKTTYFRRNVFDLTKESIENVLFVVYKEGIPV